MASTSEVLNRAADLIEERGWASGAGWGFEMEVSNLCLEGGIGAALGIDASYFLGTEEGEAEFRACPAYVAVANYLSDTPYWQHMREAWGFHRLYNWNDAENRTAAEVIEVLRAAALIEAAREDQDAVWETYAGVVVA